MRLVHLSRSLSRSRWPAGRYENADEVVCAALNLLREQDEEIEQGWTVEELRRKIQKGMESGPDIAAEEVFEELRKRSSRAASAKTGG